MVIQCPVSSVWWNYSAAECGITRGVEESASGQHSKAGVSERKKGPRRAPCQMRGIMLLRLFQSFAVLLRDYWI